MTRKNVHKQRKKTYKKKQKGGGDGDFCANSSFYPLKNIIQDILDIIFEICYTSHPHDPQDSSRQVQINHTAIEFVNKIKWNYDKLNGYYWEPDIQEQVHLQIYSTRKKNIFLRCIDQDSSVKLSDISKHTNDARELLNFVLLLLTPLANYDDFTKTNKYAENDLKLLLILVIRIISYLVDDNKNKIENIFKIINEFSDKNIGFKKFGSQIRFTILQKIIDIINNYLQILAQDKAYVGGLNKDINELADEIKKNKPLIGKVVCLLQDIGRLENIEEMKHQIKDFFDYIPSLMQPGFFGAASIVSTFMGKRNKVNVFSSVTCGERNIPDQNQITENIVPEFLGRNIPTIEQRESLDREGEFKAAINMYKRIGIGFA